MVKTDCNALSRQQLEILLILMENQPNEVSIDLFTEKEELNIRGYTERITELRKRGFNIVNTRKGYYKIKGKPEPTVEDLKLLYVNSKKRGYTNLMKRCVSKAKQMKFISVLEETLL